MKNTPARLWIMPAKDAPVALVIRRKPHKIWHFLRWDLENGTVESGHWAWGIFFPRGCDISWDGNLWTYHGDCDEKGSGLAPVAHLAPLATWYSHGGWGGGGFFESQSHLRRYSPWFEISLPEIVRPAETGSLRLGWTNEDVDWLRLKRDGWQSHGPLLPDSTHAWQQPSPAHPRLIMTRTETRDMGTLCDFSLPDYPGLLTKDVFRATYDSSGQLLASRRGVLERYTPEDMKRGIPSFRFDLNSIPNAPSEESLKRYYRDLWWAQNPEL